MERKIGAGVLPDISPIRPKELNQLASALPDKGTIDFLKQVAKIPIKGTRRPRGRRSGRRNNQCRHLECSIKKRRCASGVSGLSQD